MYLAVANFRLWWRYRRHLLLEDLTELGSVVERTIPPPRRWPAPTIVDDERVATLYSRVATDRSESLRMLGEITLVIAGAIAGVAMTAYFSTVDAEKRNLIPAVVAAFVFTSTVVVGRVVVEPRYQRLAALYRRQRSRLRASSSRFVAAGGHAAQSYRRGRATRRTRERYWRSTPFACTCSLPRPPRLVALPVSILIPKCYSWS